MVLDLHLTRNVSPHYLEKIECSTVQLFIHMSQNNVHIRLFRMEFEGISVQWISLAY